MYVSFSSHRSWWMRWWKQMWNWWEITPMPESALNLSLLAPSVLTEAPGMKPNDESYRRHCWMLVGLEMLSFNGVRWFVAAILFPSAFRNGSLLFFSFLFFQIRIPASCFYIPFWGGVCSRQDCLQYIIKIYLVISEHFLLILKIYFHIWVWNAFSVLNGKFYRNTGKCCIFFPKLVYNKHSLKEKQVFLQYSLFPNIFRLNSEDTFRLILIQSKVWCKCIHTWTIHRLHTFQHLYMQRGIWNVTLRLFVQGAKKREERNCFSPLSPLPSWKVCPSCSCMW